LTVSESNQSTDSAVPAATQPGQLVTPQAQPLSLDAGVAALRAPVSDTDPCGPDLDLAGDAAYLNFFAQVEGILPSSFFSPDDGKPFDRSTIDVKSHLTSLASLLERSRDIRLFTVQARLLILNRDLSGFSATVAAIAELLERYWDAVHPRSQDGNLDARAMALSALDLPTVIFPLQYVPLFESRRIGLISYRGWMIAAGEVKERPGDAVHTTAAIAEAIDEAGESKLTAVRKDLALLTTALNRIRQAFSAHGGLAGLDGVSTLAGRMLAFIDPHWVVPSAGDGISAEGNGAGVDGGGSAGTQSGPPPNSIADATDALAAVADYYSHSEPSSPILPLVRQAHQLIGKSFLEVMTVLMPSQVEKAAFQIGGEQMFELPVAKLSALSAALPSPAGSSDAGNGSVDPSQAASSSPFRYRVESRSQALALLGLVQLYFRRSEPSSPVPMLCERARALGDRDFMGVLKEVLPKSALKGLNADK
jgi:type VI secretion system protein ImpA